MATTIQRELIVNAIKTALDTINTGNGYYTNISGSVYIYRDAVFGAEELPAANIRDTEEVLDETTGGSSSPWLRGLTVEIDLIVQPTTAAISVLRQAIADVIAALGADETQGGNCLRTVYLGDEINSEQGEKRILFSTLRFRLDYRTNRFEET